MKKAFLLLFIALTPALFGLEIKSGDSVALFGDTIFGCGQHGMGCVALYFDGLADAGIKVKSVRAANSWIMAPKFITIYRQNLLKKGDPNVMILNFGQSDIAFAKPTPEAEYQKAMTELVKTLKAEKKTVVIMSILPLGTEQPDTKNNRKIVRYNEFLKQLAAQENCEYWDAFTAIMKEAEALRKIYPKWKGSFFMPSGHLFNLDGDRFLAKFLLAKSGVSQEQITKSAEKWETRQFSKRVNVPVTMAVKLIDTANEQGLTDSEYIANILREAGKK